MQQVELTIHGRVQGVFLRSEARGKALQLGLLGFIKNNADGTVTICAQGEESRLQELINWFKGGPSVARIDTVETQYKPLEPGRLNGFETY